jgi:hypothetical protein
VPERFKEETEGRTKRRHKTWKRQRGKSRKTQRERDK